MSGLRYPDDRMYHPEHLWAQKEADGSVRIGISDFAQDQLDSVIYIDLPSVGDHFNQGVSGASLESVKTTSEAVMPLSGTVTAVNEALQNAPETVNSDPYGAGWIMVITPDSADESGLISAEAYAAQVG